MTLSLFGFHDRPHDFAITKSGATLSECPFLLDFKRPLERIRWLGMINRWAGLTTGLLVPVVHQGQDNGEYVICVRRGEPYFEDITRLWHEHYMATRSGRSDKADGLQIVADFGRHFPEDC